MKECKKLPHMRNREQKVSHVRKRVQKVSHMLKIAQKVSQEIEIQRHYEEAQRSARLSVARQVLGSFFGQAPWRDFLLRFSHVKKRTGLRKKSHQDKKIY